jgi:hypothetical protein
MKAKIKLRNIVVIVCFILSLFSLPLVSVWKKSKVIEMIKENEMLKKEKKAIQVANVLYGYRLRQLKGRSRIEHLAEQEIGLVFPAQGDVTVLAKEDNNRGWDVVELIKKKIRKP